ncbi:MAG TPA: low temperature requirement protein A [Solirubrobacteraceae bacterium]|nr:low temperature requirement protein A [Solirubrobacteraceae bacterium]
MSSEPQGSVGILGEAPAASPVDAASIPADLLQGRAEQEKRATPLEPFFDLVFVFAITQVSGYVSAAPSWDRLAQGLAILAVLWFGWSGYAWLGNTADAEEEHLRLMLIGAMGAMLVTSLAVPHAFGRYGLIFGVGYFAVRSFHLATYAYVARSEHDEQLGRVVARLGTTMMPAAASWRSSASGACAAPTPPSRC